MDNLKIGKDASQEARDAIISVLKDHWDCFAKEGVRRTILGYQFSIDTGTSPPVCCKKPAYGPHESEIMMEQIRNLLLNTWIRRCKGAWGSMLVLAAKPHQEHVTDIQDFVWRMCVSYRGLNAVTKPFQFPIKRCDDSIITLEQGPSRFFMISADADSGYHQVEVKAESQDKLAFFAPDDDKYTFTVMPFGPTNAPGFYTAMMFDFKREWDTLFVIKVQELRTVDDKIITVEGTIIHLGDERLHYGSRSIIDDILLWSNNLTLTILYFRCVCMVFQKYRVSFKLKKCDFLKERTEYVGYDVLSSGNSPAQSKFNLINDWPLPPSGPSLHSFIGLVSFYARFCPYMEIRMKPLRKLCKKYYRKDIPALAWTQDLIQLFKDLKICVTSGPVLARYDPDKPTFLKTDWSADGMGWILMQPADDEESVRATTHLQETGECLFDLHKNGARLRPISYGSRSCTDMERKLHSFLGEVASGRWAISQNRRFLWGTFFYWSCDCSAVKEVLEYDGSISYVCRWSQELLGYHFACVHRNNRMMADVDSLTRRFGKTVAQYLAVAHILRERDIASRPDAYEESNFTDETLKAIPMKDPNHSIITESDIQHVCLFHVPVSTSIPKINPETTPCLITAPLHIKNQRFNITPATEEDDSMKVFETKSPIARKALVIDDATSDCSTWFQDFSVSTNLWSIDRAFTSCKLHHFHQMISVSSIDCAVMHTTQNLEQFIQHLHSFSIIDWTCIQWEQLNTSWIHHVCSLIIPAFEHDQSKLRLCLLWIPPEFYNGISIKSVSSLLLQLLPATIAHTCEFEKASRWGESLDNRRFLITLSTCMDIRACNSEFQPSESRGIIDSLQYLTVHPATMVPNLTIPPEALLDLHDSNPFSSRTVGLTSPDIKSISTSSMILDPLYPAREPCDKHHCTQIFNRRFGIAMEQQNKVIVIKPSNKDMMQLFSIQPSSPAYENLREDDLDDMLRLCTPNNMKSTIIRAFLASAGFTESVFFGNEETMEATRCYFVKRPVKIINWTEGYKSDLTTSAIIAGLKEHDEKSWSEAELSNISKHYHQYLKRGSIKLMDGKLFLFKPVFQNIRYVGLLIVPDSLKRPLFSHYHCGPTGGHMGEYKTLFRMRLRFHWANMRADIKNWVKGCPECIANNMWRNRRNELFFSWPVTAPFYIMHLDLWQPGRLLDENNDSVYLFNSMCDLTQFVISTIVKNPNSLELAKCFMEQVLLSYGMCSVVAVDADSKFKSVFEEMCKQLKIMFWPIARGNHKGLSVERYHRFLNKSQTIAGQSRGTHLTIFQNAKLSQYAWNSAPIDNTDVTRSMAAIGREFQFPLDVELRPTPTLNDTKNSNLLEYLRALSNNGPFAASVVATLVEERREAHRNRINSTKVQQQFKVGDAVTARVQVQSNAELGKVKKLSYNAKGPFQITAVLDANSYEVQRYNQPDSAKRKYKGSDLFLLPPAIFPQDPLDTMDHRYLNFDHTPIVSNQHNAMDIDFYNDTFFTLKGKEKYTSPAHTESVIDKQTSKWHNIIPTTKELHKETKTEPTIHTEQTKYKTTTSSINDLINSSSDKVLFIKFLPRGMMRPKWYPIQIDMVSTIEINSEYKTNNKYWCMFLAKHPDDRHKSDEYARWWPDWYKYTKNRNTGVITYGQRVLVQPRTIPSSRTHIQWAELIELNTDSILFGPFNFQSPSDINRARNTIQESHWKELHKICNNINLLPPTLGSHTSHRINPRNLTKNLRKRKRNQQEKERK